ncbi:RNA polymerase sigma factor [Streptomyces sp. Agncl-13]|uniref:RNA polymerase sigma factor n=1 Tax=Streptomyces sp. Agncl-13 TaxID=3400628 RepID=UPI003A835F36
MDARSVASAPAPAGFGAFHKEQHSRALAYVVQRYHLPKQEAEEVVADALVGVVNRWDELDNPEAFLYALLPRRAVDKLRALARRNEQPVDDPFLEIAAGATYDPVPFDLKTMLGQSADLLTPRQRQILVLKALGYTAKEIAGHLGVTENTVNVHFHRVRKLLRGLSADSW